MKNFIWSFQFFKSRVLLYILGILLLLANSYSKVLSIWIQKDIIDIVFMGHNVSAFPRLLVLFALAASFPALTDISSALVCHVVGYNMRVDMGRALLNKVFRIPMKQFQHERIGRFVDMFSFDVDRSCEAIAYQGAPRVLQWGAGALFTAIAIFMVSPITLLAVVILSVIYLVLMIHFAKIAKEAASVTRKKSSDLTVNIEESVASTREVIAFHRQKWEEKIFNTLFKEYFDAVMNEGKVVNQSLFASSPIRWLALLAVLYIGGSGVIVGKISIGGFVILYQYTKELIKYMQDTYERVIVMGTVSASIDNMKTVFNGSCDEFGKEILSDSIHSIDFENVSFKYGEESAQVLQNFNVSIPVGKKIAIVGGSGCGKSTIAKLLVRFFPPESGSIRMNGKKIDEYDYDSYSSKVSIVFQEPYMFPDTIYENLTFGNEDIEMDKIKSVCQAVCADEYIQSLSEAYETQIGERGTILSGGQRQRLAIARGILRDAEVLILDEATSSLDVETERVLQQNLDKLRKNKTTIIIAHRLSTIINSDLIYVMENGQVVEHGRHEELLAMEGVYKRLTMCAESA